MIFRGATTFSELLNDILEETRRQDIFVASCGPSEFRSITRLIAPKDLNDLSFSDLVSKMKTGASKASSSHLSETAAVYSKIVGKIGKSGSSSRSQQSLQENSRCYCELLPLWRQAFSYRMSAEDQKVFCMWKKRSYSKRAHRGTR